MDEIEEKMMELGHRITQLCKNSGIPVELVHATLIRLLCSFSICLGLGPQKDLLMQIFSDLFDECEEVINRHPDFKGLQDMKRE